MFKYFLYISVFSLALLKPSISEVRDLYKKGATSKEVAAKMFKQLENVKESDSHILLGYKAAALTLVAKHTEKVKDKKKHFKEGATLLEEIIASQPNDIELRFIRLSIQQNAPKVLKYKGNITKDKSYIFDKLKNLKDKDLKTYIKTYVLQSKSFSTAEKNVISEL